MNEKKSVKNYLFNPAAGHYEQLKDLFEQDETTIMMWELAYRAIKHRKIEHVLNYMTQELGGMAFLIENFELFTNELVIIANKKQLIVDHVQIGQEDDQINVWDFIAKIRDCEMFYTNATNNILAIDEFLAILEDLHFIDREFPNLSDEAYDFIENMSTLLSSTLPMLRTKETQFHQAMKIAYQKYQEFRDGF